MTPDDIYALVGGRFFHVEFVKRGDGQLRVMCGRFGVRKYVSGAGAKYSFADKNLLSVYDVLKRGYRCIPIENITAFRCGKLVWNKALHEIVQDRGTSGIDRRSGWGIRRDRVPENGNVRDGGQHGVREPGPHAEVRGSRGSRRRSRSDVP